VNTTIVEYLYHLPISRCEDNSVSEPHGCESNDKHMSEPSSLSLLFSFILVLSISTNETATHSPIGISFDTQRCPRVLDRGAEDCQEGHEGSGFQEAITVHYFR